MQQGSLEQGYSPLSIWLHWLMLLLLAAVYVTMEFHGIFERGSDGRNLMKYAHFMLGLSVFVLVIFRALTRLVTATPHREDYGVLQRWASKLMFLALYGLMLAMPVLGYSVISMEGKALSVLGWPLPMLLAENKELAHQLEDIHVLLGKTGYGLIALHALAALFHHFIKHDNTLKRMLRFKD